MSDASTRSVTGHYAGPISRAAAAAFDVAIVLGSYAVGYAGFDLLLDAFFSVSIEGDKSEPFAVLALGLWGFLYTFVSLAIAGQTAGKGLVGLRVVCDDGATLTVRAALARTVLLPLSTLLFGLGFVLIVLQREKRALHDLLAGTAVVYDWGDRTAQLPRPLSEFLARNRTADVSTPRSGSSQNSAEPEPPPG